MIEILERKHVILATEFDRYVVEHLSLQQKYLRTHRLFCRLKAMKNITSGAED